MAAKGKTTKYYTTLNFDIGFRFGTYGSVIMVPYYGQSLVMATYVYLRFLTTGRSVFLPTRSITKET